jgi:hypothetical protein
MSKMNLVSVLITVTMIIFRRRHQQMKAPADHQMDHEHNAGITLKRIGVMFCAFLPAGGLFSEPLIC